MTVVVETGRLVLRAWREEDAAAMHALGRDARVMEYLGPLTGLHEARSLVAGQIVNQSLFGHCFWAIERKSDRAVLGFCGLNPGPGATPLEGEIEIGWQLAHHVWGQGYAREAAVACVDWGWANLSRVRIVAATVPANARSRSLMERLGMTRRAELDFAHPAFPADHPLSAHITYALERPR